jgi:DNA-binding NtrC family response regulator
LPADGRLSIGRASENDICINHPSVSRRHATLHIGPPLRIEDVGGTNGTFLSDPRQPKHPGETPGIRRLSGESMELAIGDCVTFGTVTAVIRRAPADRSAPATDSEARSGAKQARGIVLRAPVMEALYEQARLAARSPISVLILGETGAGKEVLARTIHEASPRAAKPFLGLNCAALSESLLESELFGHEKGSFTGALSARPGLFEAADGGTVFLDELGELPMSTQVKLLRVLEERQVLRVGARTPRRVDVRFIAATNRDIDAEVARGAFRQDLFFRLNGIALTIPPLRERTAEIAPLARMFLANACAELDRPAAPAITEEALSLLERYRWPGNARELRNAMERAAALCVGDALGPEHLTTKITSEPAPSLPRVVERAARLAAVPAPEPAAVRTGDDTAEAPPIEKDMSERDRILHALEICAGNQTQAAAKLGISRSTLIVRIETYNIPRPRKKTL